MSRKDPCTTRRDFITALAAAGMASAAGPAAQALAAFERARAIPAVWRSLSSAPLPLR